MSGGHFNSNGYIYYQVYQFADELENEIENNNKKDEYGYAPEYSDEVISVLQKYIPELKKLSSIMKHIDYLYSGDHGEDSFLKRIEDIESGVNKV